MIQYDERNGCVAVYRGDRRNCLAGISSDPECIYFGMGMWDKKEGCWNVPRNKTRKAKRIYRRYSGRGLNDDKEIFTMATWKKRTMVLQMRRR